MQRASLKASNRGVDFILCRVAKSEFCNGMAEAKRWSFADVVETHYALDAYEEMEAIASEEARKRRE